MFIKSKNYFFLFFFLLVLPVLVSADNILNIHSLLFNRLLLYDRSFIKEMTVNKKSGYFSRVTETGKKPDFYYEFNDTHFSGNTSSDMIWKRSKRFGPVRCLLNPANIKVTRSFMGKDRGYIHLGVPAEKMEGAEIVTEIKDFHFGRYEIRMKASGVPGTVNAFFVMDPEKKREEIDIEFLTDEFSNNSGKVHFVVHPRKNLLPPKYHRIVELDFNPADDFHVYGFIWKRDRVDFYIDGSIVTGFSSKEGSPVKSGKGSIHINTWTGNPKWGGGPPDKDSWMIVDNIRYWSE